MKNVRRIGTPVARQPSDADDVPRHTGRHSRWRGGARGTRTGDRTAAHDHLNLVRRRADAGRVKRIEPDVIDAWWDRRHRNPIYGTVGVADDGRPWRETRIKPVTENDAGGYGAQLRMTVFPLTIAPSRRGALGTAVTDVVVSQQTRPQSSHFLMVPLLVPP